MIAVSKKMESGFIDFQYKKNKQHLLIQAILCCTKFNLEELAELLNISFDSLKQVYENEQYLSEDEGLKLAEYFVILFSS